MPRECPNCHREFAMETEFCPACGAPMNPDAYRIQKEHEAANSIVLPMKWYKFLIWVSLPLSLLLMGYNLYLSFQMLSGFDAAQFQPELVGLVRFSLYLDLGTQLFLLPMFLLTETLLIRMRWAGVRTLLFIYLFQTVYALVNVALLAQIPADVTQSVIAMGEMLAMFFLNRLYFKKRRPRFAPAAQKGAPER